MTTLGGIGSTIRNALAGKSSSSSGWNLGGLGGSYQTQQNIPTPPSVDPNAGIPDYTLPDQANNTDDLMSQIQSALSGGSGGGRGGFAGSSGSSQAQTNLSLQQQQALLAQEAINNAFGESQANNLFDIKGNYIGAQYKQGQEIAGRQHAAGLFGVNANAAASGAFMSAGANQSRGDIGYNYLSQLDSLRNQYFVSTMSNQAAKNNAFIKSALAGTKISQGQAMNDLQRSEAGI